VNLHAAIREARADLDAIAAADAAWCRQRLGLVQRRAARGQPVDRLLKQVQDRIEKSRSRVARRAAAAPRPTFDPALPITAHGEEIVDAIGRHQVVVVAGETGSGKTTQLPKLCLQAGRGARGLIACTQPRRIAARAMAERVAEELGTELGTAVGYQVRFRDRSSPDGCVKFMTDGILLAETAHDRYAETAGPEADCHVGDDRHGKILAAFRRRARDRGVRPRLPGGHRVPAAGRRHGGRRARRP
jgi:ATP-dependent helicase HrpA